MVLKSGRTEAAEKTIALHTGSLAGSDEIFSAALEKSGAIRVDNFEEFFDIMNLLESLDVDKMPSNSRVAIVTNAGGAGVLVVDEIEKQKLLSITNLSSETKGFEESASEEASVENTIDILGDADDVRYQETLEKVINDDNVDIIFVVLTPQDQTPVDKVANVIIEFSQKSKKLIIPIFIGGQRVEKFFEEV